ncbi:MAG: AAA family ATPase, partial [Lachnospiraceae bacterium]|nr:AAA family ATPase [Lachnospiraceae bacterium]
MGMFLNSKIPFESYRLVKRDSYFVDKTALLKELIPFLEVEKRFFCITRPRRFGKSVMANMIGAFFEKSVDAHEIFDT